MFIWNKRDLERGIRLSDIRPTDPRAEYLGLHGRRRRSPRFALLILIMFAILSVILAITVAFILI